MICLRPLDDNQVGTILEKLSPADKVGFKVWRLDLNLRKALQQIGGIPRLLETVIDYRHEHPEGQGIMKAVTTHKNAWTGLDSAALKVLVKNIFLEEHVTTEGEIRNTTYNELQSMGILQLLDVPNDRILRSLYVPFVWFRQWAHVLRDARLFDRKYQQLFALMNEELKWGKRRDFERFTAKYMALLMAFNATDGQCTLGFSCRYTAWVSQSSPG